MGCSASTENAAAAIKAGSAIAGAASRHVPGLENITAVDTSTHPVTTGLKEDASTAAKSLAASANKPATTTAKPSAPEASKASDTAAKPAAHALAASAAAAPHKEASHTSAGVDTKPGLDKSASAKAAHKRDVAGETVSATVLATASSAPDVGSVVAKVAHGAEPVPGALHNQGSAVSTGEGHAPAPNPALHTVVEMANESSSGLEVPGAEASEAPDAEASEAMPAALAPEASEGLETPEVEATEPKTDEAGARAAGADD